MKAVVIIFPGSNREHDVCLAWKLATGREPARIWHRDATLPDSDLIILPGGFAYGDYLRCGAMAAHSPIMREVKARAERGTPVLGICNGFQILTEAGMLPGALLPNRTLNFICRDVHLRVENNQTLFTCGYAAGQTIRVPVAHHDGNYTADPDTLDRLEDRGLIAFHGLNRNLIGLIDQSFSDVFDQRSHVPTLTLLLAHQRLLSRGGTIGWEFHAAHGPARAPREPHAHRSSVTLGAVSNVDRALCRKR